MKKLLAALIIVASLTACAGNGDNAYSTDSTTNGTGNSDATMQPGTDTST